MYCHIVMFLVIDHPNINGHILTKRTLPPRRDDVIYVDTAPYYSIYFPIPNKAKKWFPLTVSALRHVSC